MHALSDRQTDECGGLSPFKLFTAVLRRHTSLVLFAPLLFSGCTLHQVSLESDHGIFPTLPGKYRKKAADCEKRGLYREAIQSWRIVRYFNPDKVEINAKINSLIKKSKGLADDHYNRGIRFFQDGRLSDARREFLLTLAYDQDHESALDYLKNRLHQPVLQTYQVQHGDTAKKVAAKVYHDTNKDVLVLAFNDVPLSGELNPGNILQLPVFNANSLVKKEFSLGASQYDAVPPGSFMKKTEHSATPSPEKNPQVKDQIAVEKKSNDTSEDFLQQAVDAHYRKGISYFLSEDLDKAIAEWKEVLRLMPTHLKAKKDLQNARKMQQGVKKILVP